MPLITATRVSSLAVDLLIRHLVLAMTVTRIPGSDFAGGNGDTVTVRVPQARTAREQLTPGATITYDGLNEVPVDVTLAHLYNAARITDEQLSLELVDFAQQVIAPQAAAIAEGAEDEISDALNLLAADASFDLADSEADTKAKILGARQALSAAKVPAGNRFLAVSPEIATRVLSVNRPDQAGSDSAFREAIIDQVYGFTVVEATGLYPGTAHAYHRSGIAFANRTPVVPRGATESAVSTVNGVGLRQIFQYQPDILSDASVVSTFAGAGIVDVNRIYSLDTAAA